MEDWEGFVNRIKANPAHRKQTREAWERCRQWGVDPEQPRLVSLEQQELDQKLRENSNLIEQAKPYIELISTTLHGKPHLVSLIDREGWVLVIKGARDKLGGRAAGLARGINWSERYVGNSSAGSVIATGQPLLFYGEEHYCKLFREFSCLGAPIKNASDQILGVITVAVPVQHTNHHQLTLVLACAQSIQEAMTKSNSLQARLDEMDRLLATGTLLSTTVHDLRNPIAVIRGLSQLGVMNAKTAKERQYFQKIICQIDILMELLNKVLGKELQDKPQPAFPAEIIQGVMDELMPLLRVQGIKFEMQDDFGQKLALYKDMFRRAMYNLLKNAIEHMPQGGRLNVNINQREARLRIRVRDTGSGIPQEIRDQVFQPFVSSHSEGTGLGLFLTYYVITKVHQGEIWFETKTGAGTAFYIEIPLHL